MRLTGRVVLALSCLTASAGAGGQTPPTDVETGFVAAASGNAFLYTTDAGLKATSTIQLQYPAGRNSVACCLRLQGSSLDAPSRSTEPVSDALFGRPLFRYRLKSLPAAFKGDPFYGAAVIGARSVRADAASAGMLMQVEGAASANASTVEICLGNEGSNLFLIENGKLKSQIYYSFGYDVTATCDPKLFELPAAR